VTETVAQVLGRCGHTPGRKTSSPLARRSSDERRPRGPGRDRETSGLSGPHTPRSTSSSQRPVTVAAATVAAIAYLLPVQAPLRWDVLVDGFAAILPESGSGCGRCDGTEVGTWSPSC
jgi:hypothetical protein